MISLDGKVALVTGGSRGIGAAVALLFAKAGADVAITFVSDRKSADRVKKQIERFGRMCFTIRAQASSSSSVRRAVAEAGQKFGRIDILVNNAGIWKRAPIRSMSEKQWDETMEVNLKGVYLFCKAILPLMKKKGGKIINIASTAGQRGEAEYSHYAASKGGVIAFTKSIAVELAPRGVYVNCVAPGWVSTDMTFPALRNRSALRAIERSIPRGKVATPDDIAGPVLFLASPLSDHLVGATLCVNGGGVMIT
ncbi:MAG: 3-oxoacyl-ACP reductase family protein [Bacteroidota bacterium]